MCCVVGVCVCMPAVSYSTHGSLQPPWWDKDSKAKRAADAVGTVRVHRESEALCHRKNGTRPSSYITPASLDSVFIIDALGHLTCQVLSVNDGAHEDCAASTA